MPFHKQLHDNHVQNVQLMIGGGVATTTPPPSSRQSSKILRRDF